MKYLFCSLIFSPFFLLFLASANAQTVTVKIQTQFEKNVTDAQLLINGVTENLTTQKDGAINIDLPSIDSITILAKNCKPLTVATSSLVNNTTITLHKKFTWHDVLNPMFYIVYGGLWMLLFIIFAETGLFAGFFLPGDSLLFVAGIYSDKLAHEFLKLWGLGSVHNQWLDLLVLVGLVSLAGIIGNAVGYRFGSKVGPTMFNWKDTFLYKKKYLVQAKEFYEKNGGGAIIIARFLPIVRTFAPIVAGIVNMKRSTFAYYNIIGSFAWVGSMVLIGHFLDQVFPTLKDHLEFIIIGIIAITSAPVVYKMVVSKTKKTV